MLHASPKSISIGLLILRVGVGCLMLTHGVPKLLNYTTLSQGFADPIGLGSQISVILAIGAEVGCSILLILGAFTRLAVLPLAFTMIVAVFVVHGADPWKVKELGSFYLLTYVALALTGPGQFSVDHCCLGGRKATGGSEQAG
ncbi:MAG: DoxX family protein [Maioricimonas sp. JB045]|uniref:DoxX family protein n=1 Tax=Maioricimonas sp. JC845 TaxID=3232138 RepID=UPI0034593001